MIITIALEQSWALISGVAVAVTVTLLLGSVPAGISLPSPLTVALLVSLALILPLALIWLGGHRRPPFLDRWLGAWRAVHPRGRTVAACFLLYAAGIANSGFTIDLIARHVLEAPEGYALVAISVFAVAWVAGFVTLVSPGGIGVREAILVAGLTPAYGAGVALAAAISYRVITSLGDGLAFLLGFLLERRLLTQHRTQDHPSA
jgi:uncharacterized membrane protein YbhN (UPF0104 family)